jgi:hypothetical protein
MALVQWALASAAQHKLPIKKERNVADIRYQQDWGWQAFVSLRNAGVVRGREQTS